MRRLLAIAVLVSSGCSLLFNPDNVPLKTCDPLPPVAPLEALVGEGASLTWAWPNAPADAGRFKDWELCWGASAGATDTCTTFAPSSCTGAQCTHKLDGADAGLAYNKRLFGRVVARDQCGAKSTPATASATPLNGSFVDTQGITLSTTCDAGLHTDGSGVLVFDELANFFCLSSAMMGDDQWADATIDVEVRVFGDSVAGLVVRAPPGGTSSPRNGVVITASLGSQASVVVTRRPPTGNDVTAASSGAEVLDATWKAMRVSMRDHWISVSLGSTVNDLREVVRWFDKDAVSKGQLGVALAVVGLFNVPGRVELRNLRVRTGAEIPDGGPQQETWTFSGLEPLRHVRRVGSAQLAACPAYADAGTCTSCRPAAGSQCLEVQANAQATVDVPIGLDYSRPWTVRFKFAADPAGTPNNPSILRTTVVGPPGDAFGGFQLIDVPGFMWNQPVRAFATMDTIGGPIVPGVWTSFELTFTSATTTYSVSRDGTSIRSNAPYPAALGPHLGALVLGGGGNYHGYFTDLEIVQAP